MLVVSSTNESLIMKTLKSLRLVAASVLAFGVANTYAAGTADGTINLSAEVVSNCTILADDVAFGDYDPVVVNKAVTGADIDRTSEVLTTCTLGSAPTLSIDQGGHFAGGSRNLASGLNTLNYSVYEDAARLVAWDGMAAGTPTGTTAQSNIVYFRLAKGQNKPVGTYTDTVTVTVTF
jgi:spore coat protein U-like protein